jgi:hypothetical protein
LDNQDGQSATQLQASLMLEPVGLNPPKAEKDAEELERILRRR